MIMQSKSFECESYPLRFRDFRHDIVHILQDRHLFVMSGVFRVFKALVVHCDPLSFVRGHNGGIHQLTLLKGHVRHKQAEEDLDLLHLVGEQRISANTVHHITAGSCSLTDLQNVDAGGSPGTDLDILPADRQASTLKLVPLQRCNREYLNSLHTQAQSYALQGKCLALAGRSHQCHIRVGI